MRITLIESGKTRDSFIKGGCGAVPKQSGALCPFQIETLPDLKNTRNLTMKEVQEQEGQASS